MSSSPSPHRPASSGSGSSVTASLPRPTAASRRVAASACGSHPKLSATRQSSRSSARNAALCSTSGGIPAMPAPPCAAPSATTRAIASSCTVPVSRRGASSPRSAALRPSSANASDAAVRTGVPPNARPSRAAIAARSEAATSRFAASTMTSPSRQSSRSPSATNASISVRVLPLPGAPSTRACRAGSSARTRRCEESREVMRPAY